MQFKSLALIKLSQHCSPLILCDERQVSIWAAFPFSFCRLLLIHSNRFVCQTILDVEWIELKTFWIVVHEQQPSVAARRSLHKRQTLKCLKDCELWHFQLFLLISLFASCRKRFYGNLCDVDKVWCWEVGCLILSANSNVLILPQCALELCRLSAHVKQQIAEWIKI